MAPMVQKAASATILSFLGSSFILGIAILLAKDTLVRVNSTIANVGKHNEQMVALDGSISALNIKIDDIGTEVKKISDSSAKYTEAHSTNISNMTIGIVRITEKLVSIDRRHSDTEYNVKECKN